MNQCPKCGYHEIWILDSLLVNMETKEVVIPGYNNERSNRAAARCERRTCSQKFWYYPKTGRITKRG
jgi:hypothetical protein